MNADGVTHEQRQIGKDRVADLSTAKLVQVVDKSANIKADVLMIQVDRDLRSNDKRLVLEDVGDPITNETGKGENGRRRYVVKVGQTLRMGTRATGYESYRLVRVDERSRNAFFEIPDVTDGDASKDASGKKIVVTRDSEISEDVQVKKVKLQSVENKRSGL